LRTALTYNWVVDAKCDAADSSVGIAQWSAINSQFPILCDCKMRTATLYFAAEIALTTALAKGVEFLTSKSGEVLE